MKTLANFFEIKENFLNFLQVIENNEIEWIYEYQSSQVIIFSPSLIFLIKQF